MATRPKLENHTCPVCEGTGIFKSPPPFSRQKERVELYREVAKVLRKKGYSLRAIQKMLHYKNVNSIVKLLK